MERYIDLNGFEYEVQWLAEWQATLYKKVPLPPEREAELMEKREARLQAEERRKGDERQQWKSVL